jgi:diguanylate cyclase (GGDEF)-like protein
VSSQITAYIALICTSGVMNLFLSIYAFGKRHHYSTVLWFFLFNSFVTTIYCFAAAFGLLSTTLVQVKIWTVIQYIGIAFGPPAGLLFVMAYLGIRITKRRIAALLAIPAITVLMVATNDLHHLHYRVFSIDPDLGLPFIHQEIGTWYTIQGTFIFGCMFAAFLLALSRWKDTAKIYRPQLFSLICGQFVPMFTAFLYLIGLTPAGIDPVPMVLWLSSLLYFWSIRSSRLFAIMPVAKDVIFNSMNDGVVVLDESHRLIEFNEPLRRMFPAVNKTMLGCDFNQIWKELTGFSFSVTALTSMAGGEIKLTINQIEHIYHIRTSVIEGSGNSKGLLIIFTDITELKQLQRKLEHQAYYDELTQIYNRRAFFEYCNLHFAETAALSAPFTVILLDIDHFKKVNDTYGHHVGDEVLVHVATIIQQQLAGRALFARYGGEEFVGSLKGPIEEGVALAERLHAAVENQPVLTAEGPVRVTLSIGIAEAKDETLHQLLHRADQALYEAKETGRNRVCVACASGEQ